MATYFKHVEQLSNEQTQQLLVSSQGIWLCLGIGRLFDENFEHDAVAGIIEHQSYEHFETLEPVSELHSNIRLFLHNVACCKHNVSVHTEKLDRNALEAQFGEHMHVFGPCLVAFIAAELEWQSSDVEEHHELAEKLNVTFIDYLRNFYHSWLAAGVLYSILSPQDITFVK